LNKEAWQLIDGLVDLSLELSSAVLSIEVKAQWGLCSDLFHVHLIQITIILLIEEESVVVLLLENSVDENQLNRPETTSEVMGGGVSVRSIVVVYKLFPIEFLLHSFNSCLFPRLLLEPVWYLKSVHDTIYFKESFSSPFKLHPLVRMGGFAENVLI